MLATLEFCSHGFLEGACHRFKFSASVWIRNICRVAVVSHDFCDGISTLTLMLNSGNSRKSSMRMLFIDAIAPVIGAATTLVFEIQNYLLVYALAFLFGSFLYMGGGSLLPNAYQMNRPAITVVLFLTGFLLILVLTRLIS